MGRGGEKKVKGHRTRVRLAGYKVNFKYLFRPVSPEGLKEHYGVAPLSLAKHSKLSKIPSLREK